MNRVVFEETVRRHLHSAGYIAFLFLTTAIGLIAAAFNRPASLWPGLISLLAIITGSALIGPEFSTGTLQLIVTKPIRRSVYLLSRAAAVLSVVSIAAAAGFCAEAAARLISGKVMPWRQLANALAGVLIESLLIIALLTLLGSLTRSYFNVAIYMTTQIALGVAQAVLGAVRVNGTGAGRILGDYPFIERSIAAVSEFLFADAPPQLHWMWILRVVSTAVVALVLACLAFQRREVPYGSD
jgi:ABC-type transport system involved in multi-copper enzyme maturation permease subunit